MRHTSEMRWFLQGQIPEAIDRWFQSGSPLANATQRQDWYLKLPNRSDWGIKLREGKIEAKQRTSESGVQAFGDRLQGRLEQWVKWSLPIGVGQILLRNELTQAAWIAVQKRRRQKRYVLTDQGMVLSAELRLQQGCALELAEVTVAAQSWYSVGLEAFGRSTETTLIQVLETLAAEPDCPALRAADSLSYPAWLQRVLSQTDSQKSSG